MSLHFAHRRYRLPLRIAVRTAHGSWHEREGVLVRLQDASGADGYGEAAPIPWFGTESVDAIESACRELGDRVDSDRIAAIPSTLGCLKNALASALADLARAPANGESGEQSAASGAGRVADHLSVAALLPAGRNAIAEMRPKADAGFRVFKWKVGVGDVADELALLDDLCANLPDGAKLRLDANGAWDRRSAERWLERCANRPVEYVEQPCFAAATESTARRARAEDLLRGLAADYPTAIALDESLVRDGDIEHWIATGWTGVFVVKPLLLADARAAMERLAVARAKVVFSSALETAVGARAALRFAFGWRGERRAVGFGVWPLFADRRFDGPVAAPFIRRDDVERLDPAGIWKALSGGIESGPSIPALTRPGENLSF